LKLRSVSTGSNKVLYPRRPWYELQAQGILQARCVHDSRDTRRVGQVEIRCRMDLSKIYEYDIITKGGGIISRLFFIEEQILFPGRCFPLLKRYLIFR
jgi:hypothetical protein